MSAHHPPSRLAELAMELGDGDPHLSQCAECRRQLETFRSAVATMKQGYEPPEAPPFARERAIAAAVSAAADADESGFEERAWFRRRASWLLAVVPVAVLVAMWWPRAVPVDGYRVVSGAPVIAGRVIEVASSGSSAVLALGDGTRIEGAPGTRFEVVSGARVVLTQGTVRLWVTKRPNSPLRVETAEASVRVVGTIFLVSRAAETSTTRVEVSEGLVEVSSASLTQPRRLGVGESLQVLAMPEPSVEAPTAQPTPLPLPPQEPLRKEPPRAATRKRKLDIERVRSRVRAGQFAEARTLLTAERENVQSQADTAELDIVEAEMLLATGRRDEALAAYLTVSERHRSLRQGEAALFAAVQLVLQNDRARATQLLKRSLDRYPNGRFHQEVTDLLSALEKP